MKLAGPHTVRHLEEYVEDNLGADTVAWVHQGKPAVVAVGEGQERLRELTAQGWELGAEVSKEVGFHQVRRARTPKGQEVMLVWRVNGEDRTDHLHSLLRLAGAEDTHVGTVGSTRRYQDDYLKKFSSLGEPPELVVYGMAKTAAMSVLSAHPVGNAGRLWDLFSRRGAPAAGPSSVRSDMAGFTMERMRLRDGRSIWFIPPLYGDLSKDLLDALLEFGVKKFNFVGTAGGVDPKLQVGQVLSPRQQLLPDGAREELDWLMPTRGAQAGGTYQRVTTPNLETRQWAEQKHAQDVDLVEVELGYWLEATRQRKDVELRVQTVISDVVQGPNHRDMTEWNSWDNVKLRSPILTGIREALGEHTDLRVAEVESTSLV
jgi:hypothetical protein